MGPKILLERCKNEAARCTVTDALALRRVNLMSGSSSPIRAENARAISDQLIKELKEVRQRTLELVADLSNEQMIGPRLAIVNPLRWELGHQAWFQEHWLICHLRGLPSLLSHGDSFYDSARVAHDTRWDLPLPSKAETLAYMQRILERVIEEHDRGGTPADANGYDEAYFLELSLMHECMHAEAFAYTRQTLAYPPPLSIAMAAAQAPKKPGASGAAHGTGQLGDVHIPGGTFELGSVPRSSFVFDNEQWAHPVTVAPFAMARCAVTNAEFAAFVEDEGYRRQELWADDGWRWRESARAEHPVYWQRESGNRWLRRNFDSLVPLEGRLPVLHVNWYEASAYCRWAKRRLPTEVEWEMAASGEPSSHGDAISHRKRAFPWGDDAATPERANLDSRAMGCVDVDALPAGDSGFGCRQMIGNTWEWTARDFGPYPGFAPGPYKEYSAPWFGDHKVLRGGCWATTSRLIHNTYRNFYRPERRDVWAGFRTCAI